MFDLSVPCDDYACRGADAVVGGIDEAGVEDEACDFAAGVDVDIAVVAAADEEVHQLAQWKGGIVVTSEMSITGP